MQEQMVAWWQNPLVSKLFMLCVVGATIIMVLHFLNRSLARSHADSEIRYRLRKVINFSGYLIFAVFAASIFSVHIGQFAVILGVAGAGIAFALQEVIASVAGWMAVAFGGFYRPGDRIQLGGIKGDVIDIGILRTTLMECGEWVNADLYNGRIVRVANSFVFKEPVFNYSGEFPFLWDEIMVPLKYGSDYHLARKILAEAAHDIIGDYTIAAEQAWIPVTRRYLIEQASVEPRVTMNPTINCIELTLRYVVDYKLRRSTKDLLFTRILDDMARHADRVEIAAATLSIEKIAPLDVRLRRRSSDNEHGGQGAER
ncbi:MAG: mechanosensitive ion channel [Gammaproteobacteria bacterium]|nr:mechanosensitive ion channel [Gammaproteobacteria bacterium]